MNAVTVGPHRKRSKLGKEFRVRRHRREVPMTFEFAPAPEFPPPPNVELYHRGKDIRTDLMVYLNNPNAFAEPGRIVIVKDPATIRPNVPKDIEKRWAQVLQHETLHHVLHNVEGLKAAQALDRPYLRYRKAHGGDRSYGV